MANEITFAASLSANKTSVMSSAVARSVTNLLFNMTGNFTVGPSVVSIATSATAFPLGQVTAPHWAFFNNLDSTNYVTIRNGSSGADLLKLVHGECAFCPLLDTSTPYGLANTAAVLVEYMIFSL